MFDEGIGVDWTQEGSQRLSDEETSSWWNAIDYEGRIAKCDTVGSPDALGDGL